ncbi:murein transglycosylase A [Parasphingopyxis marina]|uniref:murein transglycosylase A n=1 Tax=Parasphingopyxis marina TaxID=2761622 RepID=UPI002E2AAB5F|nr:murein transglycosylase A [Parasphingopyxis marina]
MTVRRGASALLFSLALAACSGIIPQGAERPAPPVSRAPVDEQPLPPVPPPDYRYEPTPLPHLQYPAPAGENALGAGVRPGPAVASLPIDAANAARALHAFRISCPSVINQADRTGLTAAPDWVPACRAASQTASRDARDFFGEHFSTVEVADGAAFATGYYEPEIEASRTRRDDYRYPIYRVPDDLIERPQTRNRDTSGLPPVVREADGRLLPYFDRAEIDRGALAGRALEIAWARDPVALFFFHVQGGGLLRLPDGATMRLSYAGNNGYSYTSIGALMRERGLLEPGQTTSQGIQQWLRDHPEDAREIMQANRRYIFYAESTALAPSGSMGRYVTAHATVAADPAYAPLGAPIFLDVAHDIADGLWVAQDTGGAIQGSNRFDTFWGAGEEAHRIAGGMASRGRALILIPNASAERLRRSR